jgi:hypothetical protein
MQSRRITISVPEAVARRIREAATETSVSAWVTGVLEEHLEDAELQAKWETFYGSVAPRAADVRKADALFARLTGRARRGRAA